VPRLEVHATRFPSHDSSHLQVLVCSGFLHTPVAKGTKKEISPQNQRTTYTVVTGTKNYRRLGLIHGSKNIPRRCKTYGCRGRCYVKCQVTFPWPRAVLAWHVWTEATLTGVVNVALVPDTSSRRICSRLAISRWKPASWIRDFS
jgi:hypothetical protein